MANNLLSFAGWYFLPNLVTGYAQSILYSIFIRAGDPKPAPGSPRFIRDRKRIHVAVILIYLLYTVYEADWQLRREGDFYSVLGVPYDVGEKGIQSKFRRLTLQYHPDKITNPLPSDSATYLTMQTARDTLTSTPKRFAYDRFGPSILSWQACKTLPDYVFYGLQQTALYYVFSFIVLVVLGMLGYLQHGKFWRYAVMAALFCIEVVIATRPEWPSPVTGVINPILSTTRIREPYAPFQLIALLRKLAVTSFIAIGQLGPILQPSDQPAPKDSTPGDIPAALLDRLDALSTTTDAEVSRLTGLELTPFFGDRTKMRNLKAALREWLVQNTVRSDPEVKGAVGKTLGRRRGEGGGMGASEVSDGSAEGMAGPPPVPPHLE